MKNGPRTRHDMNYRPERKDTYQSDGKQVGPAVCTTCGAVLRAGRWTWQEAPPQAGKVVCPACRRIKDNYPAGTVDLGGEFMAGHRAEIISLIRHEEAAEREDHPLERIMALKDQRGRTVVTTTGVHLARRIGKALAKAYQGELSLKYGDAERSIRVAWTR